MLITKDILERQQKAFNKFYHLYKKENWNNQVNLNILKKTKKNMDLYFFVAKEHLNKDLSFYQLLKNHKKRSTIYRTLKRVKEAFLYTKPDLTKLLLQSNRPKNIRYFYSQKQKKYMCNKFYDFDNLHCKSSFWWGLKSDEFKTLSLRIFMKIINEDKRAPLKPLKIAKIKHPRRKFNVPIGNLQMDIKVLDKKENPLKGHKLYILDFIDEQTKFVYGEILKTQTINEIMDVLKRAKCYFEANGINIKRIRTDNAMMFKKTNFVRSGIFQNYLFENAIEHQFIPLNEPQCNGTIERFHRTISEEFCKKIQDLNDFQLVKKTFKKWINFYNFERRHYYSFLKEKHFFNKFFTPKKMIEKSLNF